MNRILLALVLSLQVGFASAQQNPAFDLKDPSDGHRTGTIDGTTNEIDMVGGFKEGGSDTLGNDISGTAALATALGANGTNCSAGNAPLGMDASGNTESCFDVETAAEATSHEGNASAHHTATVVHGDGVNCSAGSSPLGVDADGAVQSCFDVETAAEATSHAGDASAHHAATVNTNAATICSGTGNYLDGEGNCDPLVTDTGAPHGNGANCSAGSSPLGVDANGAVEACFDVFTETEATSHSGDASAHHTATVNSDAKTLCTDGEFLRGEASTTCKTSAQIVSDGGGGGGASNTMSMVSLDAITRSSGTPGTWKYSTSATQLINDGTSITQFAVWSTTDTPTAGVNGPGLIAVLTETCASGATCTFIVRGPAQTVCAAANMFPGQFMRNSSSGGERGRLREENTWTNASGARLLNSVDATPQNCWIWIP